MPRQSRPRIALPPDVTDRPFSVVEAKQLGIGAGRLRGKDLEIPFRGARRSAGQPPTLLEACQAYAVRSPPGTFFCSLTAAALHSLPVANAHEILHVGVKNPVRAPRAAGVQGHKLSITAADLTRIGGLWVTNAARTWRDLAPLIAVPDLVAAGDHILRWRLATFEELRRAADVGARRRGAGRLRISLGLLDPGAESPMESRLRALLVLGGLPVPVTNHVVRLPGVRITYRIDLAYPAARIAIEYQGGYHHDPVQWRADITRTSRLRAHGWEVIEFHVGDLGDPREVVDRVRHVLSAHAPGA